MATSALVSVNVASMRGFSVKEKTIIKVVRNNDKGCTVQFNGTEFEITGSIIAVLNSFVNEMVNNGIDKERAEMRLTTLLDLRKEINRVFD